MTKIEWTHLPGYKGETWNPVVKGCSRICQGCLNCYAMGIAASPNLSQYGYSGLTEKDNSGRDVWNGEIKVDMDDPKLQKPFSWRDPRFVFVNSMSDLFHVKVPEEAIFAVLDVIQRNSKHIFLILTKRVPRMAKVMDSFYQKKNVPILPNLILGASVHNQEAADFWIPHLVKAPARLKVVSAEPLLGPVDLSPWLPNIDWLIIGGESGKSPYKPRPMHPSWATSLRDQAKAHKVPFFFKQWGRWIPTKALGVPTTWVLPDTQLGVPHTQSIYSEGAVEMYDVGVHPDYQRLDGSTHLEFPKTSQDVSLF